MPIDDVAPDGFKKVGKNEYLAGPGVAPPRKCRTCGKQYVPWLPHECPSERRRVFQDRPVVKRL